jgi:hypothetical protein
MSPPKPAKNAASDATTTIRRAALGNLGIIDHFKDTDRFPTRIEALRAAREHIAARTDSVKA